MIELTPKQKRQMRYMRQYRRRGDLHWPNKQERQAMVQLIVAVFGPQRSAHNQRGEQS